jgi:hypothetical protein
LLAPWLIKWAPPRPGDRSDRPWKFIAATEEVASSGDDDDAVAAAPIMGWWWWWYAASFVVVVGGVAAAAGRPLARVVDPIDDDNDVGDAKSWSGVPGSDSRTVVSVATEPFAVLPGPP